MQGATDTSRKARGRRRFRQVGRDGQVSLLGSVDTRQPHIDMLTQARLLQRPGGRVVQGASGEVPGDLIAAERRRNQP